VLFLTGIKLHRVEMVSVQSLTVRLHSLAKEIVKIAAGNRTLRLVAALITTPRTL
jgi:hypothetical protein